MLDFRLDEEQEMLVEAIGRFSAERVRKTFRDSEEEGQLPDDIVKGGWEIGMLPTAIPEEFGGFGEHSVVTAPSPPKSLLGATWPRRSKPCSQIWSLFPSCWLVRMRRKRHICLRSVVKMRPM